MGLNVFVFNLFQCVFVFCVCCYFCLLIWNSSFVSICILVSNYIYIYIIFQKSLFFRIFLNIFDRCLVDSPIHLIKKHRFNVSLDQLISWWVHVTLVFFILSLKLKPFEVELNDEMKVEWWLISNLVLYSHVPFIVFSNSYDFYLILLMS